MTFTLNDETAWLAYADYLQDNDKPYQQVLDDLNTPQTNTWYYEYRIFTGTGISAVGSGVDVRLDVGVGVEGGRGVGSGVIVGGVGGIFADGVGVQHY